MHLHKTINGVCTECGTVDPRTKAVPRLDHSEWGLEPKELPRMLLTFLVIALADLAVVGVIIWYSIAHFKGD